MTIVDCHSHVFNAEDLPIDGFIKRLSPAPSILTGIVSVPLNELAQWLASNSDNEAAYLRSLLAPAGLEAAVGAPEPRRGIELVSDAEIDELFREEWIRRDYIAPGGLEAAADEDAALAQGIASAITDTDREELDEWLRGWGDPDLDLALAEEAGALEGPRNWYRRVKAAKRAVQRYVAALRLVTKDRHLVAVELATTYPDVALFVPALVDFTYTARDSPRSPVARQVVVHSLLAKVAAVGKLPEASDVRLHPFVGFCPYREVRHSELQSWDPTAGRPNRYIPFGDVDRGADDDRYRSDMEFDPAHARRLVEPPDDWSASPWVLDDVTRSLDIVRHAIERGGFAGVKVYPPAGYLPIDNAVRFGEPMGARLDAALRSLFAYCERMQVPILTHAGHSNGFEDGYDDFAGPLGWERVLADYPGLRVCFGHFGHLHGVGDSPANPAQGSWVRRFVGLIDQYEHVYADVGNSEFPIKDDYRTRFVPVLRYLLGSGDTATDAQLRRRRRVMFGTDFWMNTLSPSHRDYLEVFDREYAGEFGDVARAQFMGDNALRWLGLRTEDGRPDTANANHQRIVRFYGNAPLPAWLT